MVSSSRSIVTGCKATYLPQESLCGGFHEVL